MSDEMEDSNTKYNDKSVQTTKKHDRDISKES